MIYILHLKTIITKKKFTEMAEVGILVIFF